MSLRYQGGRLRRVPTAEGGNRRTEVMMGFGGAFEKNPKDMQRIKAGDVFHFYNLSSPDKPFDPDLEFWAEVLAPEIRTANKRQAASLAADLAESPSSRTLDRAKEEVAREFAGDVPVARINYSA